MLVWLELCTLADVHNLLKMAEDKKLILLLCILSFLCVVTCELNLSEGNLLFFFFPKWTNFRPWSHLVESGEVCDGTSMPRRCYDSVISLLDVQCLNSTINIDN